MRDHMRKAMGNDTELMTEVQRFWIEPAFHVPLLTEVKISWLAVAVVEWLQVRPITHALGAHSNDRLPRFRGLMTHQRELVHFGKLML